MIIQISKSMVPEEDSELQFIKKDKHLCNSKDMKQQTRSLMNIIL